MNRPIRVVCFNAIGLRNKRKRRMVIESYLRYLRRVDFLDLNETLMVKMYLNIERVMKIVYGKV